MTQKKGLLVTEYFPPVVGGSSRWFDLIVKNAQSVDWTVVTRPVKRSLSSEKIERHEVRRPFWWNNDRPFFKINTAIVYTRLYNYLDSLIADIQPDVIHAMPVYGAALPAALLAKNYDIPLVTHVFGEEFGMQGRSFYRRTVMKKVFKLSAAVVACSERTKNVAIDFGANAANSHVLFTINLANLGPIQKDIARKKINLNDGKILLTVGRLVERKGHDMVLKSLPKIIKKFPNVKYIIGGEGPYKHRLQELIQELDLNKSVIFLGHISDDELPYYYSAADIFISPNRELPSGEIEGLGIVFLEAAACGTTSIAGKSGGTESAVIHKKTGLLVDPHNVNEITTAMTSLLDDCKLRETMEEAGLKRVNDIGNIDLLIKSVEQMHLKF